MELYIGTKSGANSKDSITYFYSESLNNAKKKAKEMNLINFRKVENKHYELGVDY